MVMNLGESAAPAEENGARNLARARSMAALSDISSVSATSSRSRSRISDVVYDELSEAIRDLRLPPGRRSPSRRRCIARASAAHRCARRSPDSPIRDS